MSWSEFSGQTTSVSNINYSNGTSESQSGFSGVGAYAPFGAETVQTRRTPGFQVIPTVGSVVILNFAEIIQLTEDYYAPGSLGSFNLQIALKSSKSSTDVQNETYYRLK